MMDFWADPEFERTIQDYEYTRRAMQDMRDVVTSEQFDAMDSQTIFQYLSDGMKTIVFNDYLKRFIRDRAGIQKPLRDISDDLFYAIIEQSFIENCMSFSFEPNTRRPKQIVHGWLNADMVTRETIFLMGFGLAMEAAEVSDFLKRVIKEHDFNLDNPQECVYYHCYANHLHYAAALSLLDAFKGEGFLCDAIPAVKMEDLADVQKLKAHLTFLKRSGYEEKYAQQAYEHFQMLLSETKQIIADIRNEEA